MYFTYVLISKKSKKYYIGYCNDLANRLKYHNSGKVPATKNRGPWEIYYSEEHNLEAEAIRREQQLKLWKSRKAIERLKFLNKNRGSPIL